MSRSERSVTFSKRPVQGKPSGGERSSELREQQSRERHVRERPMTRQSARLKRPAKTHGSPHSSDTNSSAGSGQDQDVSSREEGIFHF